MLISSGGTESDVKKYHLKWIGQRKYDGVLCICENGILKGRNGTDMTKRFPNIANEMKDFNGSFMGEIVCDTFKHTCSRAKTENSLKSKMLVEQYPAKFMLFDMIKETNYVSRFMDLVRVFDGEDLNFVEVVQSDVDLVMMWEKAKKENWEGIILKNPLGRYEDKRTKSQLKVKCVKSRDIEFIRFEENPAGVKCFSEDDFFKVQVSGSQSDIVRSRINNLGSCLIEVEYLEEFETGKLRMPVCKEVKNV